MATQLGQLVAQEEGYQEAVAVWQSGACPALKQFCFLSRATCAAEVADIHHALLTRKARSANENAS